MVDTPQSGVPWTSGAEDDMTAEIAARNAAAAAEVDIEAAIDQEETARNAAIAAAVVGLLDDRGNYDASVNTFPASGGSGTAGAVAKGDVWMVSVAGVLGGVAVGIGDVIRALADAPGQTAGNWGLIEHNIGYVPVDSAVLTTDGDLLTRVAGVVARMTRAQLAADAAFSSVYSPLVSTFEIQAISPEVSHTDFATFTTTAGIEGSGRRGGAVGAIDAQVVMKLPAPLLAGTWKFVLGHRINTNIGIYTIEQSVDGSSWSAIGTIDGYAASPSVGRTELAGVTVAAGTQFVRMGMASKNAASSAYFGLWGALYGLRTGA